MTGIYTPLLGRFGNALFQYSHARALAEQEGVELIIPDWIGQKIFQIDRTRSRKAGDREVGGYCQNQESLIYTRSQVREWFKFRPEIEAQLKDSVTDNDLAVGHRRVGDYAGYGFTIVSEKSYRDAELTYDLPPVVMVTEESPFSPPGFETMPFLPDFYRLMIAPILLRGNSSFSWWSATLSEGRIFSPVIDGLGAGEHDVYFVPGNYPRLSHHHFCSDLHLPP